MFDTLAGFTIGERVRVVGDKYKRWPAGSTGVIVSLWPAGVKRGFGDSYVDKEGECEGGLFERYEPDKLGVAFAASRCGWIFEAADIEKCGPMTVDEALEHALAEDIASRIHPTRTELTHETVVIVLGREVRRYREAVEATSRHAEIGRLVEVIVAGDAGLVTIGRTTINGAVLFSAWSGKPFVDEKSILDALRQLASQITPESAP